MSKGIKISDAKKEKVIALYCAGESYSQIAKITKVSRTAISGIVKKYKEEAPDDLEHLRQEKTKQFIDDASEVVADLFAVLKRRTKTIIEDEDKLDEIIDIIEEADGSEKWKNALVLRVSALMSPKLTELTTAIGTVYDKLAMMQERSGGDADGGGVVQITQVVELTPPEDDDDD